jgi:hypothetical protein
MVFANVWIYCSINLFIPIKSSTFTMFN